jgi:hypothetical protein
LFHSVAETEPLALAARQRFRKTFHDPRQKSHGKSEHQPENGSPADQVEQRSAD